MEETSILIKFILLIELGLFVVFIVALVIKIFERIEEVKKDKYKNIKK